MIISAHADPDAQTPHGGQVLRVDLYVNGPVDGGPGYLTTQPDGRRVGYVTVRAYPGDAPEAREVAPGLWHRHILDDDHAPWVVTCSGLHAKPGHDSPDAIAELRSLEGAEQTCQILGGRMGLAMLHGAVLPIQTDALETDDDVLYRIRRAARGPVDMSATAPELGIPGLFGYALMPDLVAGLPEVTDDLRCVQALGEQTPCPVCFITSVHKPDCPRGITADDAELERMIAADAAGQDIGESVRIAAEEVHADDRAYHAGDPGDLDMPDRDDLA